MRGTAELGHGPHHLGLVYREAGRRDDAHAGTLEGNAWVNLASACIIST